MVLYTPTRTPPRRDALQKAVEEADKGSAIRRRAAEAAATAGALRIRERKMTQDKREEAQSHALGEYTRRGYEPPSDRRAANVPKNVVHDGGHGEAHARRDRVGGARHAPARPVRKSTNESGALAARRWRAGMI